MQTKCDDVLTRNMIALKHVAAEIAESRQVILTRNMIALKPAPLLVEKDFTLTT
jgi:hypothetical protein